MAIQRVEDKNKLVSKVELEPKRTYISGSWGVSGSIYVFPNRSELQKDNIDERLNLAPVAEEIELPDGSMGFSSASNLGQEVVKPFDGNSLEARRIEIYNGNFNKFTTEFIDTVSYQYQFSDITGTVAGFPGTQSFEGGNPFIAGVLNAWIEQDPTTRIGVGDRVFRVTTDSQGNILSNYQNPFVWTSNYNWVQGTSVYNKLPDNERDRTSLNYELPLALLLDGADPATEDHAWRAPAANEARKGTAGYSLGNSSLTGAAKSLYQFTGFKTHMVNGFPEPNGIIQYKQEVNAWPPEIEKYGNNVVTNWSISGYSDLSMHPRNKTQKFISFERADYDYFSAGSTKQRLLFQEFSQKGLHGEGYYYPNSNALSLSTWNDGDGVTHVPALVYKNDSDIYKIDFGVAGASFTFEFWIKPSTLQLEAGTICQLHNNYALMIVPDDTSKIDGIPQRFKLCLRMGNEATDGKTVANSITSSVSTGIYVSSAFLTLEEWSHVSIRWGRNFNNGQISIYWNTNLLDKFDGNNDGTASRTGLIDITSSPVTTNASLFVGGYPSDASSSIQRQIWQVYSSAQSGITSTAGNGTGTVDSNTGILTNAKARYQLQSELTEFRCWNYPRTEYEIKKYWKSRADTKLNLTFYLPFYFEANSGSDDIGILRRPLLAPDRSITQILSTDSVEEYTYSLGNSVTTGEGTGGNKPIAKVPYCPNWGHVAGVPLVMLAQHSKEMVQSQPPVIIGMPNMLKTTNTVVYPEWSGSVANPEATRPLYFIKNWLNIPWLRCWNSLIMPSTLALDANASVVTTYSQKYGSHIISTGDKTLVNFGSAHEAAYMMEDDTWRVGVVEIDDGYDPQTDPDPTYNRIRSWTVGETLSGSPNQGLSAVENATVTAAAYLNGLIYDHDVITPYSSVISIPILYYGNELLKENFVLKTKLPSGKDVTIVDKDNQLFIADKNLEPTAAKVGHISYTNGYLSIFHHLLSDITLEETTLEFRGSKNMHVLQFDVRCPPGLGNESNNPNFKELKATPNANESDGIVTYISTIYLHDENLNVIGKVKLAQPIQKREEDSFLFRIKMDF